MTWKIIKCQNYRNDSALIEAMNMLIAPSYKTVGQLLVNEIELCSDIYIVRSEDNELLGFFMVDYHTVNGMNCCYLGLSACRSDMKNNGIVKSLYQEFGRDCAQREKELGTTILCYWTTATAIVYHWFATHFSNVQPDINGTCSVTGKSQLRSIASTKYQHADFDIDTPFVLRSAMKQTNYAETERVRLQQASKDLSLKVFDKYQLDETKGDRFLMIGYAPGDSNN
jgi:hypothetical protein